MYAKISMIGRISSEFKERKGTNSDFISFSVAVDRPYKDKDGKRPTDFYSCTASGRTMEMLKKYSKKGDLIFLEGRPQINKWISEEGNPKVLFVVNVQAAEFIQGRQGSQTDKEDTNLKTDTDIDEEYIGNVDFNFQN